MMQCPRDHLGVLASAPCAILTATPSISGSTAVPLDRERRVRRRFGAGGGSGRTSRGAGSLTAGTEAGEVAATSIACSISRRHMNSWAWPDAPRQSMASEGHQPRAMGQ